MPANRAQRFSIQTPAADVRRPGDEIEADSEVTLEAPPLPTDPKIRAEILAGIEQGLAEARAGQGVDFEDVMAEWDALLAARGL